LADEEIVIRVVAQTEQADQALKRLGNTVDEVTRKKAAPQADIADEAAQRKIANLRNEFARLQAQRIGVTVLANTDQADRSLQKINRETQELTAQTRLIRLQMDTGQAEAQADSLLKKLQNIVAYSAGYQFFRLFEQGVSGAAQAVIGFNATLEQTRIAFTQMLGSAQNADAFLAELQQFAQRTPFQFQDLTKLSQQLMAMGISAQDVIPDLTAIGNAVAGVGGSSDVLERVVVAFGQISAAGKANAQDLRQLTEAGIPAYQMLAKTLGTDVAGAMKQVTSGTVDATTALEALTTGMNERFGGLMEAQSKTLLGRISNLKDAVQSELADIGKPLFEQISQSLDQVAQYIQSGNFRQSFQALTEEVGKLFEMAEKLFAIFANIPSGVIEFGARLAEIAIGIKAITGVSDLVTGAMTRTIAVLRGETAAMEADTAATNQNTVAKQANARVTLEGSVGSQISRIGGQAAAGAATGLEAAGALVAPVTAVATVTFVGASIADQIAKHIEEQEHVAQQAAQEKQLRIFVEGALEAPGPGEAEARYQALLKQRQALEQELQAVKESGGSLSGAFAQNIQQNIDQIQAAMDKLDPARLLAQATEGLKKYEAQAEAALKRTTTTADVDKTVKESEAAIKAMEDEFIKAHGSLEDFQKLYNEFTHDIEAQAEAQKKKIVLDQQQAEALRKQAEEIRLQAQAVGLAQPRDVTAGLKGTSKEDADQIKLIQDTFKQAQQAQDQAVKEALSRQKQYISDLAQAASQARSAISGIDLSRGLTGLAQAAPGLERARDALRDLGQQSDALNTLTSMADQWKQIADATDAASESFNGYLMLFNETDQRIQVLDALEKKWKDAQKAAEEANKQGLATPEQQKLRQDAPTVLANIAGLKNQLQTGQIPDLFGMAENFPNLTKADEIMRNMTSAAGGPKQVRIDVKTQMEQAQNDLDKWINQPREMKIKATFDTSDAPEWLKYLHLPGGTTYPTLPSEPASGLGLGGGGNWNQFQSLSQSQYNQIVTTGPMANPKTYAAVLSAAQEQNVDPRALLAFMKFENSYATNISASSLAGNNYGGIKFAGQPGASPGAISPEGDAYASFQTATDFFKALARNLTTGQYAADYAAGNLTAVRQRYVAGSATPSASQQQNIQNTVAYYSSLASQFPGSAGGGAATTGSVGDQIVALALQSVGQTKFVEQCEKFVEETIEAILGRRGATGQREATATSAFQHAQQLGLQVEKKDAQPGDLVYYPDQSGAGHVAIYMGGNKQVSTEDVGGTAIHVEDLLNNPQFIHVPGAGATGANAALARANEGFGTVNLNDPNSPFAQANIGKVVQQMADYTAATTRAAAAQVNFNNALKGADPRNLGAIQQEFTTLLPIMEKIEKNKLGPDATDVEKATAVSNAYAKTADLSAAWAEAIDQIDSGTGDIAASQAKIAQIAGGPVADALNTQLDIMKEMKATGDEIAALQSEKDRITKQQQTDQRADQDADRARQRQQTLQQRADEDADRARQRGQTLEQRGIEDARTAIERRWRDEDTARANNERKRQVDHQNEMRRIEDESVAENDAWTRRSRQIEDTTRYLEHYGSEAKKQLQDQLKGINDAHRADTESRHAQIQLATGQARGATSLEQTYGAGQLLASLVDAQTAADEAYQKQVDDNKRLQDAEDERSSQALYDLETQRLAEERAHSDRLEAISKESTQSQRAFEDASNRLQQENDLRQQSHQIQQDLWADEDKARQRRSEDEQYYIELSRTARTRALEDEQFEIEGTRIARDRGYQDELQAIDERTKALQNVQNEEKDRLQAAQSALSTWQQVDAIIGKSAEGFLAALTAALSNPIPTTGGGSVPNKAGGGYVSGTAIVGDSPSGDLTNAEVVSGNFSVLSHTESVRRGFIPGGAISRFVNGTGSDGDRKPEGDTYNLTFQASGNKTTDEEMFARLTAWVNQRDRAKEIQVRRNNLRNGADGGGRF